jgi:hypothetical protein
LNVGVIVGKDYRKLIPYKVDNNVGKMTTKVYIETVLPALLEDLISRGLTLCQDADSAHISKATIAWAKRNSLPILTLPGKSPDFSIIESMAMPLKRAFHAVRSTLNKKALDRFNHIFTEEMDQNTVNGMYKWYTKRLHECRRADGQMTRY